MKIISIIICSIIITNTSCQQQKDIEKRKIDSKTIISSIPARIVQVTHIKDSLAIFERPMENQFIELYNLNTTKKIASVGKKGKGPGEFVTPSLDGLFNNRITILDENLNKCGIFSLNNILTKEKDLVKTIKLNEYTNNARLVYISEYNENQFIGASYFTEQPFMLFNSNGITKKFGKYPIEGEINNKPQVFQGDFYYDSQRKLLLYSSFNIGYIALYNIENEINAKMVWENYYLDKDYHLNDKKLKWNSSQDRGFFDVTISKDYVIGLLKKNAKQKDLMRNAESAPRHMLVFKINTGTLTKEYNLDKPVASVACESHKNNIAYCVGFNPDWCLLKYKID
jgi:hypothetical protein